MNETDILTFAIENGILDVGTIRTQVELANKKKILQNHTLKVWQGEDGKWRTYLPTEPKRKLVKKTTREKLEEAIVEFYSKVTYTFRDAFGDWIVRQETCGISDNTVSHYQSDYKRFFEGTKFEYMEIDKITDEDICKVIKQTLEHKSIPYRALQGAFGYMNNVFLMCLRKRLIKENPCNFVDLKLFQSLCVERKRQTNDERILNRQEMLDLLDGLKHEYEAEPERIGLYAIELAMYTGMRVGELAALQWSDVDYNQRILTIQRSEKFNRKTNEYFISLTKTHKVRTIPLTDEMVDLFERIKKAKFKLGYNDEWIFSNQNGLIHCRCISDLARSRTKSIHAIRRTVNSNLRCLGVSATVTSALLGNTEKVNNEHYTYDVSNMDYKRDMLANATRLMA